jgi:hypothetical protein
MGQVGLLSRVRLATICGLRPGPRRQCHESSAIRGEPWPVRGVVMCLVRSSRSFEVARRAGITPCHEADPERAVRYGGHWWSGLTNSGGLWPGRIQRPAARTRSGGSGEEYSGRSRRWHHPRRGASVAPPPIFSLRRRAPAAATGFGEHNDHTVKFVLGFPRCPILRGG